MTDTTEPVVVELPTQDAKAADPVLAPCLSLGCLSERDIQRARSAGMLDDPAARALLDDYIRGVSEAAVVCVCAQIRTDLMLAQARADEEHATRLARALLVYLTEHRPSCG